VLSFTWENFAVQDDEQLTVDESVLRTDDGLWFRGLTRTQQLVVLAPDGYGVDDANVAPRDGRLQWDGPATFDEETLQITFIGNRNAGTGNGSQTPAGNLGLPALAFGSFIVVVILAMLAFERERVQTKLESLYSEWTDSQSTSSDASGTDGSDPEPETSTAGQELTNGDDDADEETDLELLSDEERVERLLEDNGGRMKQANIVTETGWSNAKVSQLLSSMEEEDRIDKLRIGRENLISFPDKDVADVQSDE
jgi:hypothetical protein